jgi:uncharacterized protein (DUF4415 family)
MAIKWTTKETAASHAKNLEKLDLIIKQRDQAITLAKRAVTRAEEAEAKIGRPHSGKQVVSIRLDPTVIEKFRATGPGWQARINAILMAVKL